MYNWLPLGKMTDLKIFVLAKLFLSWDFKDI